MKPYLLLTLLLLSCTPDHIQDTREQIIISEGNDSTYLFTHFSQSNMGYVERDNGDGYTFDLSNGISLESSEPMIRVKYYEAVVDEGRELEVVDGKVQVNEKSGVFRVWRE